MVNALWIHPDDNVAVALRDLPAGESLTFDGQEAASEIRTREPIPFGHKIALDLIAPGASVIKYGAQIGLASADIVPGQHVHVHNLSSVRGAAQ